MQIGIRHRQIGTRMVFRLWCSPLFFSAQVRHAVLPAHRLRKLHEPFGKHAGRGSKGQTGGGRRSPLGWASRPGS